MTLTLTLTEADLRAAIEVYVRSQGYVVEGSARFNVDKADRSGEADSISAVATVKKLVTETQR
jgi:hypothetical protein